MEFIEVSAKTVDDAITEACRKLTVSSDKLEYVVVLAKYDTSNGSSNTWCCHPGITS